jgi:hypothetical protein
LGLFVYYTERNVIGLILLGVGIVAIVFLTWFFTRLIFGVKTQKIKKKEIIGEVYFDGNDYL